MLSLCCLLLLAQLPLAPGEDEVWEKDMSKEVYIEGSRDGFDFVRLTCGEDAMHVELKMSESFEGIFYTRGSYKEAKLPCYFDATGDETARLSIPYDGCKTKKSDKSGVFSNTVIVQHDDWLIFPGDTAFELECSGRPGDADSNDADGAEGPVRASIGLADPDPGAKPLPKYKKSTVTEEHTVEFRPDDIRPRKKKKSKKKKKEAKTEL